MDSRTTQGTSSASMIILATVVFPEALPPPRPAGAEQVGLTRGPGRRARTALSNQVTRSHPPGLTSDWGSRGRSEETQPWPLMAGPA